MAKQHLSKNNLLMALGIGIGIGALIIKKLSGKNERFFKPKEKDHSCLRIPKSILQKYKPKNGDVDDVGTRIELHYREGKTHMDLHFMGFNANNELILDRKLPVHNVDCKMERLKTRGYGVFYHYEFEKPLHDLIAEVEHDKLIDWYLKPVQGVSDDGEDYVGYIISDNTKFSLVARINPCPPC